MLQRVRQIFVNFSTDRRGAVAILFGLMLIPVVMFVGAAIDYTQSIRVRSHIQNASDAAALAGASLNTYVEGERVAAAESAFAANIKDLPAGLSVTPVVAIDDDRVTVSAAVSVSTYFLSIAEIDSIDVAVQAVALSRQGPPICLLALNPTTPQALEASGSLDVVAEDCTFYVNSSSSRAVSVGGRATITSGLNCFYGGVARNPQAISPPPKSCPPRPDPFADYPRPVVGACDVTDLDLNGGTHTLSPGVYCGGIELSGSASVTFRPGIYIVKDGPLYVRGGASAEGMGVAFYLTGNGAGLDFSGTGDYHLVAPTSGPMAGFVFFLDPTAAAGATSSLSGSSETFYEGVIYLPTQKLEISGSSTSFTPSPLTMYVVDTVLFSGSADLIVNADPTLSKLPIPNALTRVDSARLID